MSLVLNIYASNNSKTTTEDLRSCLQGEPHFRSVENGEFAYENENTGVYFVVGSEPVERVAKGFRSLEMGCIVNYGRAEFFALEIFPVIASICNKLGLLVDNEQEGKPRKVDVAQLHKAWLQTNDGSMRQMQQEHDMDEMDLAYMPRKASNELWQFLLKKDELQNTMTADGKDVYVAQPLFFRGDDNQVVTAVAWPAVIPIVLPPHTDFVFLMSEARKRFLSAPRPQPLGFVSLEHVLEISGRAFVRHKDGSLELSQQESDRIRSKILGMALDLGPEQLPGRPMSQDRIIDVRR